MNGTKPEQGNNFNKFMVKINQQAEKCTFGNNLKEAADKIIDSWAPIDLKKLLEHLTKLINSGTNGELA